MLLTETVNGLTQNGRDETSRIQWFVHSSKIERSIKALCFKADKLFLKKTEDGQCVNGIL